jgi:hypothetical protein
MTAHLSHALLGVVHAASVCAIKMKDGQATASPPDVHLLERGLKFVEAWNAWHHSTAPKSPVEIQNNEEFIHTFFAKIEEMCSKFNYYNYPGSKSRIAGLNDLILYYIPWDNLAEQLRFHRLGIIFQQQEFRLQLWHHYIDQANKLFATSPMHIVGMNPSVARALLAHKDIRAEFFKLPIGKIADTVQSLNLCAAIPTLFAEFPDQTKHALFQEYPEVAKSMLFATNLCAPQEFFTLLHNSHVRGFLLSHRNTLASIIENDLSAVDAYLCAQFSGALPGQLRDPEFEDALIAIMLEQFAALPLMPGMCLLLQAREKRQGGRRKYYEFPQAIAKIPALMQKIYDDYFFARSGMTPDLALKLLRPLTKLATLDIAARIQANLFVANIHVNRQERAQALPYLAEIDDLERSVAAVPQAAEAPDAVEIPGAAQQISDAVRLHHEEVLSLQLLCHGADQPYLGAQHHLAYFDPEVRGFMNNLCTGQIEMANRHQRVQAIRPQLEPLIVLLEQINDDLGVYLPKRDTQGLLYSLGFKNATLSNMKNAMVMELRDEISGYIEQLSQLDDAQAIAPVVEALSARLRTAELQNEQYYRQYGRAIDGPGTLGGELKRARLWLNEYRQPVARELHYARAGFGRGVPV